MKGLPFWFMPLWCTLMPLTSFLLIPSIQGTIPSYVLALVSAFFVILSRDDTQPSVQRTRYFTVATPGGGDLASATMWEPTRTPFLEQTRLWRDVPDRTQRYEYSVPQNTLHPDSLSGGLHVHRPVLSLLFSPGLDALCSVGSVVSCYLRDL